MEEAGAIAVNVAGAITTALDWTSSADARAAAHSFLETIKAGDVRVLANTSFVLVKRDWSSEIRLHALKMLQHLVRVRWDQLNLEERRNFANVALGIMSEAANPQEQWPLKSQTAALVAEIVRREGPSLWQDLLPSIVSLANNGPIQAELVCMMLRWLPEDITVHNEDLEGDRLRLLLHGLMQSLREILCLLYSLLERHYGAALMEAGRQQMDVAKQHAATVTAAANAVNAYAEWAPLPDLAESGIINCCKFFLNTPDFRISACEFFKVLSSRKRPKDAASDFDLAMRNVFEILMNVAKDFLLRSFNGEDKRESEFAEYICESLVSLGSTHLQCIAVDSAVFSLYLEQMLGFFQHPKLALHYQSLLFWLALMRDLLSKSKTAGVRGPSDDLNLRNGQAYKEKTKILSLINNDICGALLDTSFKRMLKREKLHPGVAATVGNLELWSDGSDSKIDFSQYRSQLLELIRFLTSHAPLIAATQVSERIAAIIRSASLVPVPNEGLVGILESMHLPLENVVSTIFDGSTEVGSFNIEVKRSLDKIIEGLLQQLLSLKWTEPFLVEVLSHYFEALGPYLRHWPDAVGSVINKLFELLTSLPFMVKDPSTSATRRARLQICTSFIRISKAANGSLMPHLKGIASTITYLQEEGVLLRAEQNILGEAFLIMASAAGAQQQQEALVWLLEPLSKQWTEPGWQEAYLSDPACLVRLCADAQLRWSVYHTVTFFEKALKRSGFKRGSLCSESSTHAPSEHPMASHLSWMLPPLLKLLRAIHSLWCPSVTEALPGEIKAAMAMGDAEITSLIGEGKKWSKGSLTFYDGSQSDIGKDSSSESSEVDIRNWLRGIRDSGYTILGLSTTLADSFFRCVDPYPVVTSLVENIQYMEFRHIKQLVHLVLVPLVKFCPPDLWEHWLEKLLHPLLTHACEVLSKSWSSLLREGRSNIPDMHGILAESELKVEVMEEKLLRDLTREICSFFSVLAASGLNVGLPSLDQSGQISHMDDPSTRELNTFACNSMVGFLLNNKSLAVPVLKVCIEAFSWTDVEAMPKVISFCGAVIVLAVSTNNVELREFVCRDLFSAVIQGLTLESNAVVSAELVEICRKIFIYLSNRDPSPRQILLSLPHITLQDLLAFEEAVSKTGSPKEQKLHMRNLFIMATGDKLKALANQKGVNVITNVTTRTRNPGTAPSFVEGDTVGLATIIS